MDLSLPGISAKTKETFEGEEFSCEEVDRISNLPDAILCHVLSFLPIKLAAQTGILSKRWKDLWVSVPVLDFEMNLKANLDGDWSTFENVVKSQMEKFLSFVDRLLAVRGNLRIRKFRLASDRIDLESLNSLMSTLRDVEELNLCILGYGGMFPWTDLSLYESLNIMKLSGDIMLYIPSVLSFPNLKILHLDSVSYGNNEAIPNLLYSCLVLEDLQIKRTDWDHIQNLVISVPSLKRLDLDFLMDEMLLYHSEVIQCSLSVDAPKVEYLRLVDYLSDSILVNPMPYITEAYVSISKVILPDNWTPEQERNYGSNVCALFHCISNVKHLRIGSPTMKALKEAFDERPPMFRNLVRLEMDFKGVKGTLLLPSLLDVSPTLETLILPQGINNPCRLGFTNEENQTVTQHWKPPLNVPRCLLNTLKVVEICGIIGEVEEEELMLLKYILKNAMVMERMTIMCEEQNHARENTSAACVLVDRFPFRHDLMNHGREYIVEVMDLGFSGTSGKIRKTFQGEEFDSNGQDRISNLPDGILCHVLSFLPIKTAARTGILSKRWMDLWASVPVLDFDSRAESLAGGFISFMDRLLTVRGNLSIRKFRLACDKIDPECLNNWMSTMRNVEELNLRFRKFGLSPGINSWLAESLKVMKLNWDILLDIPSTISFPRLEVLHLNSVHYVDDQSITKLFSGCPVLEDLQITRSKWDNVNNFVILVPSLKRLDLYFSMDEMLSYNPECSLIVDAPKVEHLRLFDFVSNSITVNPMPYVTKSRISVSKEYYYNISRQKMRDYESKICALFWSISNAKYVIVGSHMMEDLGESFTKRLPVFHNLVHLELDFEEVNGAIFLPTLLEATPNLETLKLPQGITYFLKEGYINDYEENSHVKYVWMPPKNVPRCLLSTLKMVEIRGISGEVKLELKVIKYFLKNAMVLERMTIFCEELRGPGDDDLSDWERSSTDGISVVPVDVMDRTSSLPDGIPCHMLSFLPTKMAAQTGVLSKRWTSLWISVPVLDFEGLKDADFANPRTVDSDFMFVEREGAGFTSFMDRLLALRGDSRTRKFRLASEFLEPRLLYKWLRSLRNVEELDLDDLKISRDDWDNVKNFVISVPSVKRLDLEFQTTEMVLYDWDNEEEIVCKFIPDVKSLAIGSFTMESLSDALEIRLPMYHKLVHLEVNFNGVAGAMLLPRLLGVAPMLETLILLLFFPTGFTYEENDKCRFSNQTYEWNPPADGPHFLLNTLKVVEIRRITNNVVEELKLFKYILENVMVLENMTILCEERRASGARPVVANGFANTFATIRNEVMNYGRGSVACQVQVLNQSSVAQTGSRKFSSLFAFYLEGGENLANILPSGGRTKAFRIFSEKCNGAREDDNIVCNIEHFWWTNTLFEKNRSWCALLVNCPSGMT
ncbi:OLC1v1022804C1 [Oldenlandia corymbosa var. corymbosa]|uniref:OLC1v1022804C1 n=1 Tax=Oldenlandia corymbosa var. corymbosa TaxID=529605 RepID=A0AAV1C109_OLDCO|nr:OLC1v1022804C1 [Oldenlandia corymbosa var. corymbosa]